MRGGVARWKRGVSGTGVRCAVAYAMGGACDASMDPVAASGAVAAARYAGATVTRHTATAAGLARDELDADGLTAWFEGRDPATGEARGRELVSPASDLVLDATVNAPKSFSVAAMLDADVAAAYGALQDRVRDRVAGMWLAELNARRGHAGVRREGLARIEVVELKHERSRSLDPHKHRHLWLNTKVLGQDGQWSSVDSRVMLRFQNVVNAEGEIAARTDPEWVAALAAAGYTLDADGEIEQLAHLVKPLSRRAAQIDANRQARLAGWRTAHPGQEPGPDVLMAVDRWAWAAGRPDKPGRVDEAGWAAAVRSEIAAIDPAAARPRAAAGVAGRPAIADLDRDRLAAAAVSDADRRSAGSGGRFSVFDVRAGAGRAVAASGVVAGRAALDELLEDVAARGIAAATVNLLAGEGAAGARLPGHVKALMATATAGLKESLAGRYDRLAEAGLAVDAASVAAVAGQVLEGGRVLDAGQAAAAAAIAGTDRLACVTGPAGTGKTTMLKVAGRMLAGQGRRMVVVAPTKKAAGVAGRETGADASSLHALLHDHGFRWADTPAGQAWSRLAAGQEDAATGRRWEGPSKYPLRAGDRIVVDEAGMVDLRAADALALLAEEAGAGIAMVGDHLQALPVGHSGAMSLLRTRATAVVELRAVHRFADPAWADLTLRLRDPGSEEEAQAVAGDVVAGGHALLASSTAEARQAMADAWFQAQAAGERVCLVTATHEEAQQIGEAIQARRIQSGQIDPSGRAVALQGGQAAYEGDVIQTRRNDARAEVENRQVWVIAKAGRGEVRLRSAEDAGVFRTVAAEYLSSHAHLSYATTVHGVQGETADRSLVGPGVDAAGLYVGLTRGRKDNKAVLVAGGAADARAQLAEAMRRGRVEAGLDDSRRAAAEDLARAARRMPEPAAVPAGRWDDRRARPFGRTVALADAIRREAQREAGLRKQAAALADKIALDRATLRTLEEKAATWEARAHAARMAGLPPFGDEPAAGARQAADARLEERCAARAETVREWRSASRALRAAQHEESLRAGQDPRARAAEDAARRRAQPQNAPVGPAAERQAGPGLDLG